VIAAKRRNTLDLFNLTLALVEQGDEVSSRARRVKTFPIKCKFARQCTPVFADVDPANQFP